MTPSHDFLSAPSSRKRLTPYLLAMAMVMCLFASPSWANPELLTRAQGLLQAGNPKQAFVELVAAQDKLSGNLEFDYLLGVAALDSGKIDDAIIAFERVLAITPNHAGALLDLARAYFAAGSYTLAEAAFKQLAANNPPPQAAASIKRYLDNIADRKRQVRPGAGGYIELSLGHDSNLTGVPADFSSAVFQAYAIPGIQATGNSVKRSALFFNAQGGLDYSYPIGRGFAVLAGVEGKTRAYRQESDFNLAQGDGKLAFTHRGETTQTRAGLLYQQLKQEGAAPGEPKATNDRRMAGAQLDWRIQLSPQSQLGLSGQRAQVRFPNNEFEDFDQSLLSMQYLASFKGRYVPLLSLSGYYSSDESVRKLPDGITDKSKKVVGLRSSGQLAFTQNLSIFTQLAFAERRDQSDFARANTVVRGRDRQGEFTLGLSWKFQPQCAMRTQMALSKNDSNIAIYDYTRTELSTAIRCDMQ